MAKSVILDLLEHTIGKYVLNLDASALNVCCPFVTFIHLPLLRFCNCMNTCCCASCYSWGADLSCASQDISYILET